MMRIVDERWLVWAIVILGILIALPFAAPEIHQLISEIRAGKQSPEQQRQKDKMSFKQGERASLGLAIWRHSTRGAGTELEKKLIGITFINEKRDGGGRDITTLFKRATTMLPPSMSDSDKTYYLESVVVAETVWNRTAYNQAKLLGAELIEAQQDLSQVLPEAHKDLACVIKFVRDEEGLFTSRVGKSKDDLAQLMLKDGLREVYQSKDGTRFYCPS